MTPTFLHVEFCEKDAVKRLGASWNVDQRQGSVPAGRDLTPLARWLPVQESPAAYSPDETPVPPVPGLSLREVIQWVQSCLRRGLPEALGIRAELTPVDVKPRGVFLNLVERDPQQGEVARLKAVIWNPGPVVARFQQHTGGELAAGMQVLVQARVEVQDRSGRRRVIEGLDPAYTVGILAHQSQTLHQTLQWEGLWDAHRRLPWPDDVFNVAVLRPEGAAGLGDFQAGAAPWERFGICRFRCIAQRP